MRTTPITSAIEASDLVKTYPQNVKALDGLTIKVEPGEVFGLLGPNGAGKSTTVKILTTLARPDAGSATVAGHDVLRHPERVRQAIGVVYQRSTSDPVATGRDNLVLQGRLYGLHGRDLQRRVSDLLDRFGLTTAADRQVRTYSGGMQRRLDVALGLVHRPAVLFLDEPTTGLDPEARSAMWKEIAALAGAEGMTILLTTHYLEEADHIAARLAIVDRGRVVAQGTPDALKGALHGDAVHFELASSAVASDLVREAIEQLPGVRETQVDGHWLTARTDDGAAVVPSALALLDRAGVRVATVTVARPSLDEVYLRYAGRRFADADFAPFEPALATVGGTR